MMIDDGFDSFGLPFPGSALQHPCTCGRARLDTLRVGRREPGNEEAVPQLSVHS